MFSSGVAPPPAAEVDDGPAVAEAAVAAAGCPLASERPPASFARFAARALSLKSALACARSPFFMYCKLRRSEGSAER
eukprot:355040-Chlamydomonas_euryale.AAC.24